MKQIHRPRRPGRRRARPHAGPRRPRLRQPVHPLVGIAITGGGDKLSSVEYTNGDSKDITAGGLVQLYGGVEYHEKGSPFGFQATIGYHVDNTSARQRPSVPRLPIEAIALFNVAPSSAWASARATRVAPSSPATAPARSATATATQLQVAARRHPDGRMADHAVMGLQLRYVHETYKVDLQLERRRQSHIDGSHGGMRLQLLLLTPAGLARTRGAADRASSCAQSPGTTPASDVGQGGCATRRGTTARCPPHSSAAFFLAAVFLAAGTLAARGSNSKFTLPSFLS